MIKEFKDFINKGNIVDLAVAVIMATAFGALVQSFVDNILMQIIAAIFGKPDFSSLTFDLGDAEVGYGAVLTQAITFLGVAFAVFMVVKAYNRMKKADEGTAGPTEIDLLTEIRDSLRK